MMRGNKPLLNIQGNMGVEIDVVNTSVNLELASNILAHLHHITTSMGNQAVNAMPLDP